MLIGDLMLVCANFVCGVPLKYISIYYDLSRFNGGIWPCSECISLVDCVSYFLHGHKVPLVMAGGAILTRMYTLFTSVDFRHQCWLSMHC